MKNGYAVLLSAAVAALLFAGCGGGARQSQSFVPGTSSFGNFSWTFHNGVRSATPFPPCSAKASRVPGKYTVLAALGEFSGNSFAGSGLSLWGTLTLPRGRSELPSMAPNFGTRYTLYYGTYKLNSGAQGCFYLAKIVYSGVSFDGLAGGWPKVSKYGNATPDAEGPLAISLKSISGKGGSGTLTLKTPAGKTVASGTVAIKGSKIIK
jgi:hypothetical protein